VLAAAGASEAGLALAKAGVATVVHENAHAMGGSEERTGSYSWLSGALQWGRVVEEGLTELLTLAVFTDLTGVLDLISISPTFGVHPARQQPRYVDEVNTMRSFLMKVAALHRFDFEQALILTAVEHGPNFKLDALTDLVAQTFGLDRLNAADYRTAVASIRRTLNRSLDNPNLVGNALGRQAFKAAVRVAKFYQIRLLVKLA